MARLRKDVADNLGIDLTEGSSMISTTLKQGMSGENVRMLQ